MELTDFDTLKNTYREEFIKAGMTTDDATREANARVESMGIYKILSGTCPRGSTSPIACTFCMTGHMTECHYPNSCETAMCSHYARSKEW
jgi:hypothetical protein